MTKSLSDLLYFKGRLDFEKAVGVNSLDEKLRKHKFYFKASDVAQDFGRLGFISMHALHFISSGFNFTNYERGYLRDPVGFVNNLLSIVYWFFLFTPYVLADLYKYYPEYGIPFGELELKYFDFGLQTPRVIDDLLSFLITLDAPLVKGAHWILEGNSFLPGCRYKYVLSNPGPVEMSRFDQISHMVCNILLLNDVDTASISGDPAILNFIVYYLKNRLSEEGLKEYSEVIEKRDISLIAKIFGRVILEPHMEEVSAEGLVILSYSSSIHRKFIGHLVDAHRKDRIAYWNIVLSEEERAWYLKDEAKLKEEARLEEEADLKDK